MADSEAKSVSTDNIKVDKITKDRIKGSQDVWEKYICPACKCLLEEAVQCACGHRLCRSCAVEKFNE